MNFPNEAFGRKKKFPDDSGFYILYDEVGSVIFMAKSFSHAVHTKHTYTVFEKRPNTRHELGQAQETQIAPNISFWSAPSGFQSYYKVGLSEGCVYGRI